MISGDFAASVGRERVDRRVELGDRHDPLHEPDARAFVGATRRPVIISSSAVFGGIERSSGTVIMYGHSPTLISGVPNTASSAATTMSHAHASPKPPASA